MSDLSTKPCPECGGKAIEWVPEQIDPNRRDGWTCPWPGCGHFDKSVGRERIVKGGENGKAA